MVIPVVERGQFWGHLVLLARVRVVKDWTLESSPELTPANWTCSCLNF